MRPLARCLPTTEPSKLMIRTEKPLAIRIDPAAGFDTENDQTDRDTDGATSNGKNTGENPPSMDNSYGLSEPVPRDGI